MGPLLEEPPDLDRGAERYGCRAGCGGVDPLRGIAEKQRRQGGGSGNARPVPGLPNVPAHAALAAGAFRPPNGAVQQLRAYAAAGVAAYPVKLQALAILRGGRKPRPLPSAAGYRFTAPFLLFAFSTHPELVEGSP